jgi:5-methylcytosine-specific restriction enzyme subunit McrC
VSTSELPVLVEYESTRVRLTDVEARQLARTNVVTVSPDPEVGWWKLTAQDKVGSVVVGDLRLLIRPKIKPENLFLLLEVGLTEKAWRREAFEYAITADLLPSVISFFARTLKTTLARGVLRSYRERHERLLAPRGRLDIKDQLNRTGLLTPVSCQFDEYTADIIENRYLKRAARLALRVPRVPVEDRRRLVQELAALEDVDDVVAHPEDLDRIIVTRLNAHYEPALRLARLILDNLTLADQQGQASASSFVVDMNKLFERFVTERLRRALVGRLEVEAQSKVHLATRSQVLMKPDLLFKRRGSTAYVADIKYKLTDDALGRTYDYYQLLAYTTALDLPEGLLIYCLSPGGRPERSVTVRHAGKILHTKAIDLTGSASDVAAELAGLTEWIADRARGPLHAMSVRPSIASSTGS